MEMSQDDPGAAEESTLAMEMNQDDPGAVEESIENGNGDVDVCKFTSPVFTTPTDLLDCPSALGNSNGVSEGHKGCVVANNVAVSCKSPCPLTVSEADLSKCEVSSEGNCFSVANNDKEEKIGQHDDVDFTVEDEDDHSKFLGSIEDKVSDTAEKIFLSRERKKSKYLCYPFISLGKESKALPFSVESEIDDSKSPGSKKKRESRKSVTSSIKLETLTATSADLVMQLHMVALDHLNPYYNNSATFDSTMLLFKSFRASVFSGLSDAEVIGAVDDTQNEEPQKDEEDADFNAHVEKQNKKAVKRIRKAPPPGLYDVNVNLASNSPLSDNMKDENQQARKRGRPKGALDQKKRMKKKGTTPGISYINGNNVKPISLEVCLQDAGPYPTANSIGLNACTTESKIPTSLPESSLDTNDKLSAEVTIDQMKQSLQFMTAMLETSANTISSETRACLEKEIQNLLKKVNPMG